MVNFSFDNWNSENLLFKNRSFFSEILFSHLKFHLNYAFSFKTLAFHKEKYFIFNLILLKLNFWINIFYQVFIWYKKFMYN